MTKNCLRMLEKVASINKEAAAYQKIFKWLLGRMAGAPTGKIAQTAGKMYDRRMNQALTNRLNKAIDTTKNLHAQVADRIANPNVAVIGKNRNALRELDSIAREVKDLGVGSQLDRAGKVYMLNGRGISAMPKANDAIRGRLGLGEQLGTGFDAVGDYGVTGALKQQRGTVLKLQDNLRKVLDTLNGKGF